MAIYGVHFKVCDTKAICILYILDNRWRERSVFVWGAVQFDGLS